MSVARRVCLLLATTVLLGLGGGWVASLLVKRIPAFASAQAATPVEKTPPDIHPIVEEDAGTSGRPMDQVLDGLDYAHDASAFRTFRLVIQGRLRKERFEELEEYAAGMRAGKTRFPGGDWRIQRFIAAVAEYPGGTDRPDRDWLEHLAHFQAWMKRMPDSLTARTAYADALTDFAWKARGTGWASSVGKEGWKLFRERLQQARDVLEEVPPSRRICPMWYRTMLTVALGQSWERKEYDELFQSAIGLEPLFQSFYTARAYSLLPRWYGEEGEWVTFAEENANRIGGDPGDAIYYYIAMNQSDFFGGYEFFKENKISWPRMKRGFEAIERAHGTTDDMRHAFCRMSGWVCDRPTALAMLQRIGEGWNEDVWDTREALADFKDWAHQKGKYAKVSN